MKPLWARHSCRATLLSGEQSVRIPPFGTASPSAAHIQRLTVRLILRPTVPSLPQSPSGHGRPRLLAPWCASAPEQGSLKLRASEMAARCAIEDSLGCSGNPLDSPSLRSSARRDSDAPGRGIAPRSPSKSRHRKESQSQTKLPVLRQQHQAFAKLTFASTTARTVYPATPKTLPFTPETQDTESQSSNPPYRSNPKSEIRDPRSEIQ